MTVKSQILAIVNLVPETELPTLLEVIRRFVPVDWEDTATPDDIEAHNEAMREYAAGETAPHEMINWE